MLMELNVGGGLTVAALGLMFIAGLVVLEERFVPAAFCAFVGWFLCSLAFDGFCPGICGALFGLLFFVLFG